MWLPVHETETFCDLEDISAEARRHLAPLVERAAMLQYSAGRYQLLKHWFDPTVRDSAAYVALHDDGIRALQIGFAHTVANAGGNAVERKIVNVTTSFFTGGLASLNVQNHKIFMDDGLPTRRIVLKRRSLEDVSTRIDTELRDTQGRPMRFRDFASYCDHAEQVDEEAWTHRIERGLFRKLPADEEADILSGRRE